MTRLVLLPPGSGAACARTNCERPAKWVFPAIGRDVTTDAALGVLCACGVHLDAIATYAEEFHSETIAAPRTRRSAPKG